MNNLKL